MPAIVGGVLLALAVVIGVIAVASDGGEQRTVTTVVLDTTATATTAPGLTATFPLGAVLPSTIDGWTLAASDPGVVNLELEDVGDVETAQATSATGVGLLVGVHPSGEDARVVVERIRADLGGTKEGPAALTGITSQGIVQSEGGVFAVTFATPDRAILAFADTRDAAVSLATATSEALGP